MDEKENMTIFDFLPPEPSLDIKDSLTYCSTCLFDCKGCCSFNTKDKYCVNGDSYAPDFKKFKDFEEVVSFIGYKIGVKFHKGELVSNYVDYYQEYIGEKGNIRIEIHKDEHVDSELPYIAVDVTEKDCCGGFGSPCDSINEAISYLERKIRLYA